MSAHGAQGPDFDGIRDKYLQKLHELSGHAVISYMSGWLEAGKRDNVQYSVQGADVHGLMEVCYQVPDRKLDLILHSPGGSPQAAEQMLEYLRTQFDYIRAIVPLQAKSAATMIALGCDEILMGEHSELGPIDPQILVPVPEGSRFAPAHAILRDFERAKDECTSDVNSIVAWTPILRGYAGGLIEFCHQQIELSMEIVEKWLAKYMLSHEDVRISENERATTAKQIAEWFGSEDSYDRFRTHSRPIRQQELRNLGLRIKRLEEDDSIQDVVLSIYHATQIAFSGRPPVKIIENHLRRRKVYIEHEVILQAESKSADAESPQLNRQQRRAQEAKRRGR